MLQEIRDLQQTAVDQLVAELKKENNQYLWSKNCVSNSFIKFEYYLGALHSSFLDFVMKDKLEKKRKYYRYSKI